MSQSSNGTLSSVRTASSGLNDRIERFSETSFAYLILAPVLTVFTIVALWPILYSFETSFFADSFAQFRGGFVGLSNYVEILTGKRDALLIQPFFDLSNPFQSILPMTLIYTVLSVTAISALGFAQALVLNKTFRGRSIVRVAILLPWAVPIVIQGMIFYLLFVPGTGLLTQVFNDLGLMGPRPLSNSSSTVLIVTMAAVWKRSAFVALIVLAGLQSIDRRLYDVGKVAGASRWETFRLITLPQVMPALLISMLMTAIGSMRVYGQINTMSSCTTMPSMTCAVVGTFNSSLYGTATALAMITALLIGLVSLVFLIKYNRLNIGGV